jgi:hypothetical protein
MSARLGMSAKLCDVGQTGHCPGSRLLSAGKKQLPFSIPVFR